MSAPAWAENSDPAAARAQLERGYALKQQGKCDAAISNFVESLRLDRQPKALLNLADCEEKLGKLATALAHFAEARDLARAQRLGPLQTLAEQRRQALEKRVARLSVRLAKDAPAGTAVTRDGVELGAVSLNTSLPIDPGNHVIVVRSTGSERAYEVTIAESETKEIEVTPVGGRPLPTSPVPRAADAKPAPSLNEATPSARNRVRVAGTPVPASPAELPPSTGLGGQRIAALITGGAGLAATAVGGYFAVRAQSAYNAADCDASNTCSPQGVADQNVAYARARSATIATVGGLVGIAAGFVLWVTAPTPASSDAATAPAPRNRLWLSADPMGEGGTRSVTVGGTF